MLTARRLYLYAVSGIALILSAIGLATLLRLTLEQLMGARPLLGDLSTNDQLAVGLAFALVGLPLFAIHWWLTERTVRGESVAADLERRSVLRSFALSLVLAISLATIGQQIVAGIEYAVWRAAGELDLAFGPRIEGIVAVGIVALVIWALYARARHRDVTRGPLDGAAAWLSRLYLYGAIVAGALVALVGVGTALQATGREIIGAAVVGSPFVVAMATATGFTLVGGVAWYVHHGYAQGLTLATDFRRPAERASLTRQAADVIMFAACVGTVAVAAAASLAELLRLVLGVHEGMATSRLLELVMGPVVTALPFAIAGWWVYERSIRDGDRLIGPEGAHAMRRAQLLVLAGAGLVLTGVGVSQAIAMALDAAVGSAPLTLVSGRLSDLATWLAAAIIGLPVWFSAWLAVEHVRAREAAIETASTARRTYLFLVIGSTLTVAGVGLAYIVYELVHALVDGAALRVSSELATAIGAAIVGTVVLAYHVWILRGDVAARAAIVAEEGPAVEAAPAIALAGQEILLVGPPDADFEDVDRVIREHLPSGYSLRILGPTHGV